jgi:acyl-CoA thioester hydrolase
MFSCNIQPRFLETDALGHINNNTYGNWFEAARDVIFRIFIPNLDPKSWNLIVAHTSFDFLQEVNYGKEVVVKTAIEKIGNSSFTIIHAIYQDGKLCTSGKCIMIYFNHQIKKSETIPEDKRNILEGHLFTSRWPGNIDEF